MRDLPTLVGFISILAPFAIIALYGAAGLVRNLRTAPPSQQTPKRSPSQPQTQTALARYNSGELPLAGLIAHMVADNNNPSYPRHARTELIPVVPPTVPHR